MNFSSESLSSHGQLTDQADGKSLSVMAANDPYAVILAQQSRDALLQFIRDRLVPPYVQRFRYPLSNIMWLSSFSIGRFPIIWHGRSMDQMRLGR